MSRDARKTRNLRKQILNELQKYLEVSETPIRSGFSFLWRREDLVISSYPEVSTTALNEEAAKR